MVKKILVTGGAGYIGAHTCKALANSGYIPVCYDNLVYGHRAAVKWGPLEIGDISDRQRLDQVILRYKPEAVMHFAAYAYVGESVQDPGKYYRNNVSGSLTLLEAARDHNIDKFIFSSTCATYGFPDTLPIGEDSPQVPINPYGASKLMIERMLNDFDSAHGLRSISLRYFNAAGADPCAEIGEDHTPETHLIPLVLDVAVGRRHSVEIYGDDYETVDGTCVRDYIHVSDLADAHVLALKKLESAAPTSAYNLGNGQGFSVREIISAAEAVSGTEVKAVVAPRRAGDPACLVANAQRAKVDLGWQPKHMQISEILETAWRWHLKLKNFRH